MLSLPLSFDLPVRSIGRSRWWCFSSFWTRDTMYPVDKTKACSQLVFFSDGDSANLPAAIFYAAEHGVVNPN